MQRFAFPKASIIALTMSLLLIMTSVLENLPLVLCVEPGGHIALELTNGNGQCADRTAAPLLGAQAGRKPTFRSQAGREVVRSNPCVDVPLSVGQLADAAQRLLPTMQWREAPVVKVSQDAHHAWLFQVVTYRLAQPPPLAEVNRPLASLALLKTVVLIL